LFYFPPPLLVGILLCLLLWAFFFLSQAGLVRLKIPSRSRSLALFFFFFVLLLLLRSRACPKSLLFFPVFLPYSRVPFCPFASPSTILSFASLLFERFSLFKLVSPVSGVAMVLCAPIHSPFSLQGCFFPRDDYVFPLVPVKSEAWPFFVARASHPPPADCVSHPRNTFFFILHSVRYSFFFISSRSSSRPGTFTFSSLVGGSVSVGLLSTDPLFLIPFFFASHFGILPFVQVVVSWKASMNFDFCI